MAMIGSIIRWSQPTTPLNLFGIILTLSRGAIVSVAICLLVYLIILVFIQKKSKVKAFISLSIIFVLIFILFRYTLIGMGMWAALQEGKQASSVNLREILWYQVIQQIQENPFGNGIVWKDDPHNIILRCVRDLGIIFGPVFLLLISYPFLYFQRIRKIKLSNISIAILIAYLSVFIHAMAEVFYFSSLPIIWVMMILSFLSNTLREEKP